MIRAPISAMLFLAMAVPTAPIPGAEGFTATDKWSLNDTEAICTLTRHFAFQDEALELVIRPTPLSAVVDVTLDSVALKIAHTKGVATIFSKDESILTTTYQSHASKTPNSKIVVIEMPRNSLSKVARDSSISVMFDGSDPLLISITSLTQAIAASTSCEAQLLSDIGFTPDPGDGFAVTPAVASATSGGDWVQASDYPRDLRPGRSVIGWIIGADGLVHNCHGLTAAVDPRLPQGACNGLTKRGKFVPARDESGKTVPSFHAKPIVVR